jgi:hypothetical protein
MNNTKSNVFEAISPHPFCLIHLREMARTKPGQAGIVQRFAYKEFEAL